MSRPLVGAENFRLHILEFGCDEALATDSGLLACIMGRSTGEIRLGDLDEIAKDRIETHLQGLDPGARDFPFLQLSDPGFPVARGLSQLVEARVEAIAENPALLGRERGESRRGPRQPPPPVLASRANPFADTPRAIRFRAIPACD